MSSSPSSTDEGRAEEQGWLAQATISVRLDETVVAVSLGWAIASAHLGQDGAAAPENATCAGNACESKHSSCRHVVAAATDGYVCDCDDGFQGNPYIAAGCQRNPTNGSCQGCYSNTRAPIFFLSLGLSIGVGALLIILGILIFRNHKHRRTKKLRQKYFRQNRGQLLQQLVAQRTDIAERMIIPLEKLEGATNNFDKSFEIGGGAHGTVYKGILSDLHVIAIKKSRIVVQREIDEFINEIAILSQINHRNVVKLIGCCLETEVPLLVYEFVSNGTLYSHLHVNGSRSLPWSDRLRIATEIAKAIAYLHSSISIPIIHRDIKSTNILLDDSLTSKVSDFGASRYVPNDQTGITTKVQGTFGYMDPTYYYTQKLTEKSDVYSFGVILVELLTRKKPFLPHIIEGEGLIAHFVTSFKEGNLVSMLDMQIMEETDIKEVEEIAALAVTCVKLRGEDRPTMRQVEMTLENASGNESKNDSRNSLLLLFSQERRSMKAGTRQYSLEEEILLSARYPR